jgi:hypothetical protein
MTRELDSRSNDGMHIRLLSHADDGQPSVTVEDTKTGDAFEVPIDDRERALDVFHHPYAYAAWRPARTGPPSGAATPLAALASTIKRARPRPRAGAGVRSAFPCETPQAVVPSRARRFAAGSPPWVRVRRHVPTTNPNGDDRMRHSRFRRSWSTRGRGPERQRIFV